jgi:integrase
MNDKRERGTGRLFLRGTTWWCQYYFHGQQIRASCETNDEKKAGKFLKKKVAEVLTGTHIDARNLRYADLRAAYLLDYQTNMRKSLHRDKQGNVYLDAVKRLDDFFPSYRAHEIDASVIRQFHADQQAKQLSNASINRSVSALRRMFHLALQDGRLRSVPYFPMLKEGAPRQGFFERDQFEQLLAALPDYLRLPLALGYFTGMRLGEVINLQWSQIDFLNHTITLRAGETKNDHGRIIPVVPQLRTLLTEQRATRQGSFPFVCFRLDKRSHAVKIGGFRKAWQNRCCKLGLGKMEPRVNPSTGETFYAKSRKDRRNAKPKVKMIYRGMLFHDLRRTFVRNLVRSGTPEKISMKFSGHLSRSVFDRYDITSGKDVLEAGERLGAYLEKSGDKTGTTGHQIAAADYSVN